MSPELMQVIAGLIGGIVGVGTPTKIMHTRLGEISRLTSQQNDAMLAMSSTIRELEGGISAITLAYQSTINDMQSISKQATSTHTSIKVIDTKIDSIKETVSDIHRRLDSIS